MERVTCPSCSFQFEPSGRRPRCPICGTRVGSSESSGGSLLGLAKLLRWPAFFTVAAAAILLHVPGIVISISLFASFCIWAIKQIGARQLYGSKDYGHFHGADFTNFQATDFGHNDGGGGIAGGDG